MSRTRSLAQFNARTASSWGRYACRILAGREPVRGDESGRTPAELRAHEARSAVRVAAKYALNLLGRTGGAA